VPNTPRLGLTVAVKVTPCPYVEPEEALEVRVVVVETWRGTVVAASAADGVASRLPMRSVATL
jgi:hypothetical protein